MTFVIDSSSHGSKAGIGRRLTFNRCCHCWRHISVTPAIPIQPITSLEQRSCWLLRPSVHSATEASNENKTFARQFASILFRQQVNASEKRHACNCRQLS